MQDAEHEYPLHQPQKRIGNGHHDSFDDQTEPELAQDEQRSYRRRQRSAQQHEEADLPELPRGRLQNALIAGVIAGALCSIESIIIAFANTSNYQQAGKFPPDKIPFPLALALLVAACLTFVIGLLICFIAGYVTGRIAVQRRLGFLAGFVAGIVTYGISFLLNFIPNYPGHLVSRSGVTNAGDLVGGLLVVLIFFLIWGVIGGLVSLLGAWIATRRHPYYIG